MADSFMAFLTHDWGIDQLGRNNHARVARVAAGLREEGVSVWFDEDEMRGDINRQMADGIDASATVVVFVTERYLLKASGKGDGGDDDNCKFELDYGLRRKGVAKMLTVVMEPSCRNTSVWTGSVGGKLGGKLYVDMCCDEADDAFGGAIRRLAREIRYIAALGAAPPSGGGHPQVPTPQPEPAAAGGAAAPHAPPRVVEPGAVALESLDSEGVLALMRGLGFGDKYAAALAAEKVVGADLAGLTTDELSELGVTALHRRRLLTKLPELVASGVPPSLLAHAPPAPVALADVRWLEARANDWEEARAALEAKLIARGVRRGQLLAFDAHCNGPEDGAIFAAFYSLALPDLGALALSAHRTLSSELGWGSFYERAADEARRLPAAADLVGMTASCAANKGGVLYTLAYTAERAAAGAGPLRALEWAEERADTWDGAARALVAQLWAKGVRKGQVVSISAHNNAPDGAAIFVAFYSTELPERGDLNLNYAAQNANYSWAEFYEKAAASLGALGAREELVAITGACNAGGKAVMYVFSYAAER